MTKLHRNHYRRGRFEVRGVRVECDGTEACITPCLPDEDPEFWSVYEDGPDGLPMCIRDYRTQAEAVAFVAGATR